MADELLCQQQLFTKPISRRSQKHSYNPAHLGNEQCIEIGIVKIVRGRVRENAWISGQKRPKRPKKAKKGQKRPKSVKT
jgi:hypothetical protein